MSLAPVSERIFSNGIMALSQYDFQFTLVTDSRRYAHRGLANRAAFVVSCAFRAKTVVVACGAFSDCHRHQGYRARLSTGTILLDRQTGECVSAREGDWDSSSTLDTADVCRLGDSR